MGAIESAFVQFLGWDDIRAKEMRGRSCIRIREKHFNRHMKTDLLKLKEHQRLEHDAALLILQARRMRHVCGRLKSIGRTVQYVHTSDRDA